MSYCPFCDQEVASGPCRELSDASTCPNPTARWNYDMRRLVPGHDIPYDIIAAERKLSRWFRERGIDRWKLGESQSRDD